MANFIENGKTTAYVATMLWPNAKFGKKNIVKDGITLDLLHIEVVLDNGQIIRDDWFPNRRPGSVDTDLGKGKPIIQWGVYADEETGETIIAKSPKWVGMYDGELHFFDGYKPEFGEGWEGWRE